jgi:hypothetical protein
MTTDIHQLIAAINPDAFCDKAARSEVKRILKAGFQRGDSLTYANAGAKARSVEPNRVVVKKLELENPFSLPGFKSPVERHALIYDSMDESMEALYFWMLDELTGGGWTVAKLIDNFAPSPGSGLFPEMGQRGLRAQQQAMKLIRETQMLVAEVLRAAEAAKAVPASPEDAGASEPGRAEVEKAVLRSKLETLKLYARWLGPYLRQTQALEQARDGGPALVKVFNTTVVQVSLLAQREYPVEEDVAWGVLPKVFLKVNRRKYFPTLVIEIKMRAAPELVSRGAYAYRGQMEIILTSYALNEQELSVVRGEIERDDLREVVGLVVGKKAGSLSDILNKLEALLAEPEASEPEPDDPNPFTALFDFKGTFREKNAAEGERQLGTIAQPIRADSDFEKVIRSQAILDARRRCSEFYEQIKRRLQMPVWSEG